jgi:GAF domain-containing protein
VIAGHGVVINRDAAEQGFLLSPFGDTSRPSASLLFAPMRLREEVVGIITVQSYTPGRFTEKDLAILQEAADMAAPAIQRCRSEQVAQVFFVTGQEAQFHGNARGGCAGHRGRCRRTARMGKRHCRPVFRSRGHRANGV